MELCFFRIALVLFNRVDLSFISELIVYFLGLVSNDVFFVLFFHKSLNQVIIECFLYSLKADQTRFILNA